MFLDMSGGCRVPEAGSPSAQTIWLAADMLLSESNVGDGSWVYPRHAYTQESLPVPENSRQAFQVKAGNPQVPSTMC